MNPQDMRSLLKDHLEWMRMQNYSERTVRNCRVNVGYFIAWCEERGVARAADVSKPVLDRYRKSVYHHRKEDGMPLSFRSQHIQLSAIRVFFKWLAKNNHVLYNPASELELPRLEKKLPRNVLTAEETERVLNQPNTGDPIGIRDHAILETLYSTGMRRMELAGLAIYDIEFEKGTVMLHGKGRKDRMVPIGERALAWVERYLFDVRPSLVLPPDPVVLFLTGMGAKISLKQLTHLTHKYVEAAGVGKQGSCHLFRHTLATLMLENGADIRYIQQMLGHAELSSTEVYTHVSIGKLKEVHNATHPGARLKPRKTPEGGAPREDS
jgi:integrase/recombinase XerD